MYASYKTVAEEINAQKSIRRWRLLTLNLRTGFAWENCVFGHFCCGYISTVFSSYASLVWVKGFLTLSSTRDNGPRLQLQQGIPVQNKKDRRPV